MSNGPIKKRRKKHARSIRKGVKNVLPSGKVETHKMEWYDTEDNKGRKRYHVTPSITFDKEGKKKSQSYEEAKNLERCMSLKVNEELKDLLREVGKKERIKERL